MPSVMNSTQLRMRFFLKIATLLLYAKFKKIDLLPICFYRSDEDQLSRHAQGRTTPGKIVTYCDGFYRRSKHQDWRAFDFVIVINDELVWSRISAYEKLGAFWRKIGGKWGGDFSKIDDIYHFEG